MPQYSAEVKTAALYYHETEDLSWPERLTSRHSARVLWNGGKLALKSHDENANEARKHPRPTSLDVDSLPAEVIPLRN